MKNFYINKNIGSVLATLFLTMGLAGCTVYSQGQQYPNNNVAYDQQQSYGNSGYDDGNEPEITYDNFYSALSPYGTWMNYGNYGQVWVCSDPNFRPYYSNGYWVNTNMGWSWNSGYSWGWAPFHYGRWGFADNIGWYWTPGYQWAPAWVYWGNAANNYAWAPLAPGMDIGIHISIGAVPLNYWTYLPGRYMGYANMNRYYLPATRNNVYIHNTTIINNYTVINRNNNIRYAAGPRADEVSRFTGRPVNTVRVVSANNVYSNGRISNGTMSVYRPGRNAGRNSNTDNRMWQGNNNPNYNQGGGFSRGGNRNNNAVNNDNRGGGLNGRTPGNNANPSTALPNTNNNGNNRPNWNRGAATRNTPDNVQRTVPAAGTNNPTVNRPDNSNRPTRWGSWNGGSSNSTTSQTATGNGGQNRPASTPTSTSRNNWQPAPRANTSSFGSRANTTRQPAHARDFSGGRFSSRAAGDRH